MRFVYGYDQVLPSTGADAEQVFNNVAALSRRGVEIDLLVPRPARGPSLSADALKARYKVQGDFRVDHVGYGLGTLVRKGLHAVAVVRDPRVKDATAVYTRHLQVAFAAVAADIPVLYETYRPWPDQYPALRGALRMLFTHRRFLGAITHSRLAADSFVSLGVPAAKVVALYNGHDPTRLEPRMAPAEARAALGQPTGGFVATYAGRVEKAKGLDATLEIARACPDITFQFVGSEDPEGPIEKLARGLPNVRFVPWQPYDALVKYLYASDVLLLPTSLAPLEKHGHTVVPIKIFQYLAVGRVILGPTAPDVMELLRHDDNALLVPPGDTAAAAAALRRVQADAAVRDRLATSAQALAADLTWDARAGRIVDFVERRLRGR
jgi:glycosyltransferase involved in cell wall biosynthesis